MQPQAAPVCGITVSTPVIHAVTWIYYPSEVRLSGQFRHQLKTFPFRPAHGSALSRLPRGRINVRAFNIFELSRARLTRRSCLTPRWTPGQPF